MNLYVLSVPRARVRNGPGVYDFAKGVDPGEKIWVLEQRDGGTSNFFIFPKRVKEIGRILAAGGKLYVRVTDVDAVLEEYRDFIAPIRYDVVESIVRFRLTPRNTVIFADFRQRAFLLPVAKEVE